MQVGYQIVVLAHLVGFAALLGGCLVQLRSSAPEVNGAMLAGAWTQLVTGVALVAILELGPDPVSYVKVGVKLAVTAIVVLLVAKNRRFVDIPKGLWAIITGLSFANAAVAVLWV